MFPYKQPLTLFNFEVSEPNAQMNVNISSERSRTAIGPQGDHVSAYALIKYAILTAIGDGTYPVETSIMLLFQIVEQMFKPRDNVALRLNSASRFINDDKNREEKVVQCVRDAIYTVRKQLITPVDFKELSQFLDPNSQLFCKISNILAFANAKMLEQLASDVADTYLIERNKLLYASFPQVGNLPPPSGEGARVSQALKTLREKNEQKEINNAEVNVIAQCMLNLFWYPKIPIGYLVAENSQIWQQVKSKYKQGTKPRDNDLEILYTVTANHIELICICFRTLSNPPQYKQIVNRFIQLVANKGEVAGQLVHWSMTQARQQEFFNKVQEKLPAYHSDFYSNASRTPTPDSDDSVPLSQMSVDSKCETRVLINEQEISDDSQDYLPSAPKF